MAGSPGPIIDYFNKLKKEYNFLPENIYNMDEKGFMSNRTKVACRAGWRPPQVAQDGTCELITVIETVLQPSLYYHRQLSIREPLTIEAGIPN